MATRVSLASRVTASTQSHDTNLSLTSGSAFSSGFSAAFGAALLLASTQSHDTQVTQTTSGIKLIRADGERGYYKHRRGQIVGGERGYFVHRSEIQRSPVSLDKIQLARTITASAQNHDTQVTQTTSGKKQILSNGSRGYFLGLNGVEEATTYDLPFVASTGAIYSVSMPFEASLPFVLATGAVYAVTAAYEANLPFITSTGSIYTPVVYLDATARITAINRTVAGPSVDDSAARVSGISRTVVGPAIPPAQAARITGIYRTVIGPPRETAFANATLFVGLTWIEVTTRSGAFYVWSDRQLPDPSFYYGGYKEARVIEWGKIRRSLSGFDGQYETTDFSCTLSDLDRLVRGLDAANELLGATVVARMITDEERRALGVPRTAYRGLIKGVKPLSTLKYQLTIKDPFAEQFTTQATASLVPPDVFETSAFPNCSIDTVTSSANDYLVNSSGYTTVEVAGPHIGQPYTIVGGVHTYIKKVLVDGGYGQWAKGDKIKFSGHSKVYDVTGSSWSDPETYVEFTPDLVAAVADNETITQLPTHKVDISAGKRCLLQYGHVTDYKIVDGVDIGDGRAVAIYAGDRLLSDGKVYGEWVWARHACYSPGGKPIQRLYFWNESVDNLAPGEFYLDGVFLENLILNDLTTEAGAGGRLALPGFGNWTSLGFTTSYSDIAGKRYTRFFMRGIWRDWALKIAPAPDNLGGVPFAVDAYGCETVVYRSGTLISKGMQQYLHIVKNWCPPASDPYTTGPWLGVPTYPDGTPMIDSGSFNDAQTQSEIYVAGGAVGNFTLGVDNEAVSRRDLLARLNISFGVDSGFNRKVQYFVTMMNRNLASIAQQPELDYVRDIFAGSFSVDESDRQVFSAINYRHTRDYWKRVAEGWRSVTTGVTEVVNSSVPPPKTTYSQLLLYMLQGKNRSDDSDEYTNDFINLVLAMKLARISSIQRLPKLQVGPAGFNYELADVFPLTHYEGVSSVGWTQEPVRIERVEYDPSQFTCFIEGYQIAPMLVS